MNANDRPFLSLFSSLSLTDKPPVLPENFNTLLQEAEATFAEVSKAQQLLGGKVYSLSALDKKIVETYKEWEKEAEKMHTRLLSCQGQVHDLQRYIPSLPIAQTSTVLAQIFFLRISLPPLLQEVKKLLDLTKTPDYEAAHTLCKTAIEECEKIGQTPSAVPALQRCNRLFETTYTEIKKQSDLVSQHVLAKQSKRLDTSVERQILELHLTTLELFHNRMKNILTADVSGDLLSRIQDAIVKCPLKKTPLPPSTSLTSYIQSFKTTKLPSELNFKQLSEGLRDWWNITFTYSDIKDPIQKMKNVARGIVQVGSDLQKDMQAITKTNLREQFRRYQAAIDYLRVTLQEQKKLLLEGPSACQVHAGLFYAVRIERALSELNGKVQVFSEVLASDAILGVSRGLHRFLEESQKATPANPLLPTQLEELFLTIRAYPFPAAPTNSPLAQSISDLLMTSKQVVSVQANNICKTGLDEARVFNLLIRLQSLDPLDERPIDARSQLIALPNPLVAFLERECIKKRFFPEGIRTAKLDIILFILEKFPGYKPLYDATCAHNTFSSIIADYRMQCSIPSLPPYFQTLALLFGQLVALETPGTNIFLNISTYSRACYLTHKCDKQISEQPPSDDSIKLAKDTLQSQALQRLAQSKQTNQFPAFLPGYASLIDQLDSYMEPASLLFSLVTTALYDEDSYRRPATTALRSWLASKKEIPEAIRTSSSLRYLFAHFVFPFRLNNELLCPVEQLILNDALLSALKHPLQELAFQKMLTIPNFERLLYKNTTDDATTTAFVEHLKIYRGERGYESWTRGIYYYNQFLLNDKNPTWIGYMTDLLTPYLQDPTSIESIYLEALKACLAEMRRLSTIAQP